VANNIRQLVSSAPYFEVLPSAARTTAPDTQEFEITGRGYEYDGLHLIIDVTAFVTAASLTVKISGVDRVSGKTYDLIVAPDAIVATGTVVYKIAPAVTPVTKLAVSDNLPPVFRVTVTHGNANSHTYSIGGMLV